MCVPVAIFSIGIIYPFSKCYSETIPLLIVFLRQCPKFSAELHFALILHVPSNCGLLVISTYTLAAPHTYKILTSPQHSQPL
jgi:hypothetical protein